MISPALRNGLLLSTGLVLIAACEGGGDVASTGTTGPVTIGGTTGTGTGGNDADFDFVGANGCPSGLGETTITEGGVSVRACEIPGGTIAEDLTLDNASAYALTGSVFVGESVIGNANARTATLTIPQGTVLFGSSGRDALFVSPGSDLVVEGSAARPVVMTSFSDIIDGGQGATALQAASDGTAGGDGSTRGAWGGLVVSGLAPINDCADTTATPGSADCTKDGEGGSGLFGGDQPDDDSGSIRYLRVQYAGFAFSSDNELNGIAFQGVGSGTEVDFVQVHNNQDDGVEFFGGTVNADHLLITGAGDDSIDWTDGWTGTSQFAVVVQTPGDGDNGIEGDNRGDDVDVTPRSSPVIANFTFIGQDGDSASGIRLRAGTDATLINGVVVGFDGNGLRYADEGTGPDPEAFSLLLADNGEAFADDGQLVFDASDSNVSNAGSTLNGLFLGDAEDDVEATDVDDTDGSDRADDLEDTDYIGAFDDDVQSIGDSWLAGWTLTAPLPNAAAAEGCPEGTRDSTTAVPTGRVEARVCTLLSPVLSDTRLTRGNLYEISGTTFVGEDAGGDADAPDANARTAELRIDAGVTLFGASGRDALVIRRGSQISANGTAAAPIVMTSGLDVGTIDATGRDEASARGEWGGLVINGRAPINDCGDTTATPGTAACEKDGEGGSGLFGGGSEDDDSGNLNYVRVQYAGFAFSSDNELNGIAFQGVGSDTEVDFVQVHNNQDDGVEFFGGTVDVKHLVVTGAGDDSIDWTDGWTGDMQFAIVTQSTDDGDRAIEGDNRGDDVDLTPRSNPTLANLTLIGRGDSDVVKLRAGTDAAIYNSILLAVNSEGDGIDFDQETGDGSNTAPTFFGTYVVDVANTVDADGATGLFTAANGNVDGAGQDSTLTADGTDAALVPGANETAVSAVDVEDDDDDDFFEDADFIGAVEDGDDEWYVGWTISL